MIAKLEVRVCLIVYFADSSYLCSILNLKMILIKQIFAEMLVLVLQWENLISRFISIVQQVFSDMCGIRYFSSVTGRNLARGYVLWETNTYDQTNWGAPEQVAIGTSY